MKQTKIYTDLIMNYSSKIPEINERIAYQQGHIPEKILKNISKYLARPLVPSDIILFINEGAEDSAAGTHGILFTPTKIIERKHQCSWTKIRYDYFTHPYEKVYLETMLDGISFWIKIQDLDVHIRQLIALIQHKAEKNKNAQPLGFAWERRDCQPKLSRLKGSIYFLSDRIHMTLDTAANHHPEPIDPDDFAQIHERIEALERENALLGVPDKISERQRKQNQRTIKHLNRALEETEQFLIRDIEQIQLYPKWPPKIQLTLPPTKGLFGKKKAQTKMFEVTEKPEALQPLLQNLYKNKVSVK